LLEWTTFQERAAEWFIDVTVTWRPSGSRGRATGAIRDLFYSANTYLPLAIGGGTVTLSNGGFLAAFDATSGTKQWQRQAVRHAPAFGQGRIYVQNYDSLLALNTADGSVQFSALVRSTEPLLEGSPMVVDDAVFTSQGGMRRFNASTLNQTWSQTMTGPAAIANGLLYTFGTSTSSSGVTAVDASTGQVAFEVPGTTSGLRGRNLVLGSLNNAIGICGIYNENTGQCLASFDLPGRTQAWMLPLQFEGTPSVGQGVIYVLRRNFDPEFRTILEARRESDGQLVWSWFPPAPQQFFTPPNVKGDIIVTRNVLIVGMSTGASFPFPNQATWIVDLATRKQLAAFPPGRLAISSQGVLYIAGPGNIGDLTAVALK
jgi:outer membrane protein assembly factor BamB